MHEEDDQVLGQRKSVERDLVVAHDLAVADALANSMVEENMRQLPTNPMQRIGSIIGADISHTLEVVCAGKDAV